MEESNLPFQIGPLLYSPASNATIADAVLQEKLGRHFSLALCLEDTISDDRVAEAEHILLNTLRRLASSLQDKDYYLPLIFIRVRAAEQMSSLYKRMKEERRVLTGFIAPKFAPDNADGYIRELESINAVSPRRVSLMPILESPSMIDPRSRADILYTIKDKLDTAPEWIPNVRVGGNDLCHAFGFRRRSNESIYEILPVAGILSDIMTVFGMDYCVSGPVWEYYDGPGWKEGLENEIRKDRLNGFIGKTVIHPKQISLVNKGYMVEKTDYEDALSILNWDCDSALRVSGNTTGGRMNEYKTHYNWARRIISLAGSYGVHDN